MITDVHRPRLLPYAATLAPLSKAGDVARQLLLTADTGASGTNDFVFSTKAISGPT